jgi:hypothetical protein
VIAVLRYSFGRLGDRPVVADYDGNRMESAALARGGTWYLRADNSQTERVTVVNFAG